MTLSGVTILDKYEYNLKLEEIDKLVDQGDYEEAAALADTIDWRRVRNVRTLCLISEIYEAADRLDKSKEMLVRAYRKSPVGRTVLYRLVEVTTELGEYDEALEYYTEYVQVAPHDNNRFILKYMIYKGRGSSPEELIAILEEYLGQEYTERWAYELALNYQQAGQMQKCLATCDDLVLWFHSGKYVKKALELKGRYAELTPKQEQIYQNCLQEEAQQEYLSRSEDEFSAAQSAGEMDGEVIAENIIAETEKEIADAVTARKAEKESETEALISEEMSSESAVDSMAVQEEEAAAEAARQAEEEAAAEAARRAEEEAAAEAARRAEEEAAAEAARQAEEEAAAEAARRAEEEAAAEAARQAGEEAAAEAARQAEEEAAAEAARQAEEEAAAEAARRAEEEAARQAEEAAAEAARRAEEEAAAEAARQAEEEAAAEAARRAEEEAARQAEEAAAEAARRAEEEAARQAEEAARRAEEEAAAEAARRAEEEAAAEAARRAEEEAAAEAVRRAEEEAAEAARRAEEEAAAEAARRAAEAAEVEAARRAEAEAARKAAEAAARRAAEAAEAARRAEEEAAAQLRYAQQKEAKPLDESIHIFTEGQDTAGSSEKAGYPYTGQSEERPSGESVYTFTEERSQARPSEGRRYPDARQSRASSVRNEYAKEKGTSSAKDTEMPKMEQTGTPGRRFYRKNNSVDNTVNIKEEEERAVSETGIPAAREIPIVEVNLDEEVPEAEMQQTMAEGQAAAELPEEDTAAPVMQETDAAETESQTAVNTAYGEVPRETNKDDLQVELARSMRKVISGVARKPEMNEDDVPAAVEDRLRSIQETPARKEPEPKAGKLSIDDILLAMGEKGKQVARAARTKNGEETAESLTPQFRSSDSFRTNREIKSPNAEMPGASVTDSFAQTGSGGQDEQLMGDAKSDANTRLTAEEMTEDLTQEQLEALKYSDKPEKFIKNRTSLPAYAAGASRPAYTPDTMEEDLESTRVIVNVNEELQGEALREKMEAATIRIPTDEVARAYGQENGMDGGSASAGNDPSGPAESSAAVSGKNLDGGIPVEEIDLTEDDYLDDEFPQKQASAEKEKEAEAEDEGYLDDQLTIEPHLRGMFTGFTEVDGLEDQIANAILQAMSKGDDRTSRSGNILIFGAHGAGKTTLATAIARAVAQEKGNQVAKMARIYASDLNRKDIAATIAKIAGGTLIIEEAGDLEDKTVEQLTTAMEFRTDGLLVILEDEQRYVHELLMKHPRFTMKFTAQIYLPDYTLEELLVFGDLHAGERGYKISDEAVEVIAQKVDAAEEAEAPITVSGIIEMVDDAIRCSNRFFRKMTMGKKRYDEDNYIVLFEKDFK